MGRPTLLPARSVGSTRVQMFTSPGPPYGAGLQVLTDLGPRCGVDSRGSTCAAVLAVHNLLNGTSVGQQQEWASSKASPGSEGTFLGLLYSVFPGPWYYEEGRGGAPGLRLGHQGLSGSLLPLPHTASPRGLGSQYLEAGRTHGDGSAREQRAEVLPAQWSRPAFDEDIPAAHGA